MPVILRIRDGDPQWWNSPDIWVVPGSDPNGPPGQPVAGQGAFLWARVHNEGDRAVSSARVAFYWSNPALGVLRSNSTLVGSAFVDLAAGETKEVLCVIPWVPVVVNDGHECLVAQVVHAADPLPTPLPDPFDPPSYRQVAQKNLSVLKVAPGMIVLPIQLAAPPRAGMAVAVATGLGGELDERTLVQLGLEGYRPVEPEGLRVGLSLERNCEGAFEETLRLKLAPGEAQAVFLRLESRELELTAYTLLHVFLEAPEQLEGGLTYVVTGAGERS